MRTGRKRVSQRQRLRDEETNRDETDTKKNDSQSNYVCGNRKKIKRANLFSM